MEVVRGAGMVFVLVILFLGGGNRKVVAQPPRIFFLFLFPIFLSPSFCFFFPQELLPHFPGGLVLGGEEEKKRTEKNDVCWVFDPQVFLPSSGTPPTPHFPPPFLFLPSYCSPSLTISPKYIFFPFATKLWSRYAPALFGNGVGRK